MKKKSAKKTAKKAAKQAQLRTAALRPGRERIGMLQKLLKSNPDNVGVQYELAKAQLSAANASARIGATVGTAATLQPAAIAAASAPSIGNALGAAIGGRTPHDPRSSLRGVWDGSYRRLAPDDLPLGDPTLPSLRETHEIVALEKELAEVQRSKGTAESMQRVAQLSYMLTRARLIQGHRDGSLGGRP
jgi:hypothetical protein